MVKIVSWKYKSIELLREEIFSRYINIIKNFFYYRIKFRVSNIHVPLFAYWNSIFIKDFQKFGSLYNFCIL